MAYDSADEFAILRRRLDAIEREAYRRELDGLGRMDRTLVGRVFDGGAMPDAVPRFFKVHPVTLDGTEAVGEPVTIAEDTSDVAVVMVLGPAVPEVGDVLIAKLIGGYWVAQRGGGATINVCLTVRICSNTTLSGVGLVVERDGSTIASGTTDISGRFCFTVPALGEIVVTPTHGSYPDAGEVPFVIDDAEGANERTLFLFPCGTLPDRLTIEDDHGFSGTMVLHTTPSLYWECFQFIGVPRGIRNPADAPLPGTIGWQPVNSPCYPSGPVIVGVRFRLTCSAPDPIFGPPSLSLRAFHQADHPAGDCRGTFGCGGSGQTRWVDYREFDKSSGDPTRCVTGHTVLAANRAFRGTAANGAMTCSPFSFEGQIRFDLDEIAPGIMPPFPTDHSGDGSFYGYVQIADPPEDQAPPLFAPVAYNYTITPEAAP
jgi:hypothetical protein